VGQNDRKWIIASAALVNEVHAEAVDVRAKMRESVHGVFLLPPVVAIAPPIDERAQLVPIVRPRPISAAQRNRKRRNPTASG
jgi:hypothetical protein